MKKIITVIAIAYSSVAVFGQTASTGGTLATEGDGFLKNTKKEIRTDGWKNRSNYSLLFSQAAFSNWVSGGINSTAVNGRIDKEYNLTAGKDIWDNRIILGYGIQKLEDVNIRKTDDVIDISSSYGHEIKQNWYAAALATFKTQFGEGFNFTVTPNPSSSNRISNFMSPGYVTIGLGVDYKPSDNFQLSFHPLTAKITFVTDKQLQVKGNYGLANNGDSSIFQFGAFLGARYRAQLMENIIIDNRLGLFSNYLNKPENIDVAYTGVLAMKINKYITTQVAVNVLYDEDQIKKTQVKEIFGVGINYAY